MEQTIVMKGVNLWNNLKNEKKRLKDSIIILKKTK